MLLFLIIFYFHYVLFNCDEMVNAKFNETLMIDNHHQNLLQAKSFLQVLQKSVPVDGDYGNGTTKHEAIIYYNNTHWRRNRAQAKHRKDQKLEEHKKNPAELHPSSQHDRQGLPHTSPRSKLPLPSSVQPLKSSPYLMALFPLKTPVKRPGRSSGYQFQKILLMYSMDPKPPHKLIDYRYQNIYLRSPPPGARIPRPGYKSAPNSTRLPFIYVVNNNSQKKPLRPTISPLISNTPITAWTSLPVTSPSPKIRTTSLSHNAQIWLKEIAPYTPVKNTFKTLSEGQPSPQHSEMTKVPIVHKMSKINAFWSSTGPANKEQLFEEGKHGLLDVTPPEKDERQVQTAKNKWMPIVTGKVQHGKVTVPKPSTPSPKQRYLDLMEQLEEGYMMVFIVELCRMISVKDRRVVGEVLYHTREVMFTRLWDNGRLAWIGDPLETVLWKLSGIMSERNIKLVRTYASMMFHMLLERKQTLSADVNAIIDEADLFYNDDDGDRLLSSLKQFENYPTKTKKTSYWLCDNLIQSFLVPFRRQTSARRRRRLLDTINNILKQRFPHLLSEYDEGTIAGKASTKNESQLRERKRDQLPSTQQETKRHRTPKYSSKNITSRRQYSEDKDYTTMTPGTSNYRRFRATKSYRKKRRTSTAYSNIETPLTKNRKSMFQMTLALQEDLDSDDSIKYSSTKKAVHSRQHFSRKTSRSSLRLTTSKYKRTTAKKTIPFQDDINSFEKKNDKSPARQYQNYFSRKTSTAGHRTPRDVTTLTDPVTLPSSEIYSPSQWKGSRIDKIPFSQKKEKFIGSEGKEKDKKLKLEAELLINISESSNNSDDEVLVGRDINEPLEENRTLNFVDETR